MIKDNVVRIQQRIAGICERLGRDPRSITLVGVTKFAPVEKINEAIAAGIQHVAENKVQEGEKKYPHLVSNGNPLKRHLIGHLQSNKAKDALLAFDLIQSVDSLKLAQEIEKQTVKLNIALSTSKVNEEVVNTTFSRLREERSTPDFVNVGKEKVGKTADILIQINTAAEDQKFGARKSDAAALIESILKLEHLRVLGFMAMAPMTEDQSIIRAAFRDLREIRDQAAKDFQGHPRMDLQYLSMGMSGDFEIALEEGSNMVRIGSAIFNPQS